MALPTYLFANVEPGADELISDNNGNLYYNTANTPYTIYKLNSDRIKSTFYTSTTLQSRGIAFNSDFTYLYTIRYDTVADTYSIYKYSVSSPGSGILVESVFLGYPSIRLVIDSNENIFYVDTTQKKIMKWTSGTESEFSDLTAIDPNMVIQDINISSVGGTPYIYAMYNINENYFGVAKIDPSTAGPPINGTLITGPIDTTIGEQIMTSTSGIFVLNTGYPTTTYNIYKYSYAGGAPLTTSYISQVSSPFTYQIGSFDNTGTYLYVIREDIANATKSIITTKPSPPPPSPLPTYPFANITVADPRNLVSDNNGNFYFFDDNTPYAIYKVDSNGNPSTFYTSTTEKTRSIAFNSDFTFLYSVREVVATGESSIYKYDVSSPGNGTLVQSDFIERPDYILIDTSENIYYISSDGKKILKLTSGSESTFADLTSVVAGLVIRNITISSVGGTPYMYALYNVDASYFEVYTINFSDNPGLPLVRVITGSGYDKFAYEMITNSSGIFIRDQNNYIYKYYYTGGFITSSYISRAIFPDSYTTFSFDNAGTYLYVIYYNETTDTYSIRSTKAPPPGPQPICFKEGSKILCLQGTEEEYVEIQNVRKNMLVKTSQSGYKRVDKVGTTVLYNDHSNRNCLDNLYICKKDNYPELTEDLIMTGSHSILVDTMTDKQKETTMRLFKDIYVTENKYRLAACIDSRAKPYEVNEKVNIWHLSLEHTNKFMNYGIYANGLLVESASKRMMSEISGMKMV